jgi:hypothetical protein
MRFAMFFEARFLSYDHIVTNADATPALPCRKTDPSPTTTSKLPGAFFSRRNREADCRISRQGLHPEFSRQTPRRKRGR